MEKCRLYGNLIEMIEDSVKKYEEKTSFIVKKDKNTNENISFLQFYEDVKALSCTFEEKGYAGKTVAIVGKNCYEWIVAFLATLYTNGVVVPLDKGLPEHEMESQLLRSKTDALLVTDKRNPENLKCAFENDIASMIQDGRKIMAEKGVKKYEIDNKKMSVLIFTSGTTDNSKAVMLSQYNFTANIYGLVHQEDFKEDDTNMVVLPLNHTFGITGVLLFICLGITNSFCDGLKISKSLKEYKPTILVCVPLVAESIYKLTTREIAKKGLTKVVKTMISVNNVLKKFKIDLSKKLFNSITEAYGGNLRFLIVGGAPFNKNVEKWFNDIGILTVLGYGLTETAPVLSAESVWYNKYGSVGIPMKNVEVKIDCPDDNGVGEIIAKGDNVMLGYFENEELTNEVLKDGWFHTGDIGYIDNEGFIFITGRKKNVIVLTNGKNVFPEEIEQVIYNLEYVKECVVYGEKNNNKDSINAKIVYDETYFEGKTLEEVKPIVEEDIKKINEKLVGYKKIKNLIVTNEPMEKTTTMKIKRNMVKN